MPEPANMQDLRALTSEEKALVEQSNQLAFDFLTRLNKQEPDNNVFFSPLSIAMAMGMLYSGSKEQQNSPLEFSGSENQVNKTFNELTELLTRMDKDVKISFSNSFWHHRKYIMNDLYKDKIMAYYQADAEAVNFESSHASNYIHRIVSFRMNKEIENFNYSIPLNCEALLLNVIGFSGQWAYHPEVIVQGRSMQGSSNIQYEYFNNAVVQVYQDEQQKLVDIPYGNGQYSMTVISPKNSFLNTINYDDINALIAQADTSRINLYLPVIDAKYQFNLNNLLDQLSIPKSNEIFVGQTPKGFDAILQDARLDAPISRNLLPVTTSDQVMVSERTMVIDKPFIFLIREKHTGIILFVGKHLQTGN